MVDTNGDVFQLPDYTIGNIRKAIPPERFEVSALRGLGYIARDITLLLTTFWVFHHSVTPENVPSIIARGLLWSVYGFLNGLFGTGSWVMGHGSWVMGHGSRVWSSIAVPFESSQ
jgi:omega-6 fatty acid desaturase (delta-12 desaturase)